MQSFDNRINSQQKCHKYENPTIYGRSQQIKEPQNGIVLICKTS